MRRNHCFTSLGGDRGSLREETSICALGWTRPAPPELRGSGDEGHRSSHSSSLRPWHSRERCCYATVNFMAQLYIQYRYVLLYMYIMFTFKNMHLQGCICLYVVEVLKLLSFTPLISWWYILGFLLDTFFTCRVSVGLLYSNTVAHRINTLRTKVVERGV